MTVDGDALLVLVTAPLDRACDLGRALVDERLAACVNVVPCVASIHAWEGKREEAAPQYVQLVRDAVSTEGR